MRLQELHRINLDNNVYSILRRYFAMNGFDGAIASLGIVMGFFVSGLLDVKIILITFFATSFALFISGFWAAYLAEEAERIHEIKKLEKKLLFSLKKSKLKKATKLIAFEAAIVNGCSSAIACLFIVSPFFLTLFGFFSVHTAYFFSIGLALLSLVLIGLFLSAISNQNKLFLVLKMLSAGFFAILFSLLIGTF